MTKHQVMDQPVVYFDPRSEPPNWKTAFLVHGNPKTRLPLRVFQMPVVASTAHLPIVTVKARVPEPPMTMMDAVPAGAIDDVEPAMVTRAFHIRLRPDREARICLKHLQEALCKTQNETVQFLNTQGARLEKRDVVAKLVTRKTYTDDDAWMAQIPEKLRATKVRQMVGTYNHLLSVYGRDGFEMRELDRRTADAFVFDVDAWEAPFRHFISSIDCANDNQEGKSRSHGVLTLARGIAKYPNGDAIPEESRKIRYADSPWLVNELVQNGLYKTFSIKWDRARNQWFLIARLNVATR